MTKLVRVRRTLATLLVVLLLALTLAYRREISPARLEVRYADGSSQFVEVAGSRVHFKEEGSGAPLLLLHGTGSSLHTWDGWVAALRSEFRLIRLDLPAFGLTGPDAKGDYSLQRRAEVLLALLDHLRVSSCSVAGNSLGGAVALQLALTAPERVDRLVLIDSAGYPRQRKRHSVTVLDFARIRWLSPLLSRFTPRWLVARAVKEAYGDPSRVTHELVDRHYELLLRRGNRQALLDGLAEETTLSRDALRSITQPVLLLWGSEDRLIAVEVADRFHEDLRHSQVLVYDGVGHVPMEEIPHRSASDAGDFLAAPLS